MIQVKFDVILPWFFFYKIEVKRGGRGGGDLLLHLSPPSPIGYSPRNQRINNARNQRMIYTRNNLFYDG